ncbi:MAG: signal transduction histidine kinase/CheY-like chemotaxis protein [Candidatus Azotimanducaceae bacterium]
MFFKKERKSAAALSALMSQTNDTMVCFEFRYPIDLTASQAIVEKKLRDAIIVEASRSFALFFGFERREEIIGQNLTELFHGDIPTWFLSYGKEVEDSGFENIERLVNIPLGKRNVPMKIYMQSIFSGKKLASQWVTLRDFSVETESARIIEENERLKLLALETVGLRTFSLDFNPDDPENPYGEMIIENQSVSKWWESIYAEDRILLEESFADFYRGNAEQMHNLYRAHPDHGEEPSWREIWAVASRRNSQGRPEGIAGVVMDRTESKALENRLVASQRLESLGVMAGGIAHDFNNLLMSVTGTLDVLMKQRPELLEDLKVMDDAARQAAQLCDQLLTYAGRGSGNLVSLNLHRTIEDIRNLLLVALDKDARLTITADENYWVRGDASQLAQVMMNLTKNASDALEGKPGEISIQVNHITYQDDWRSKFHLGRTLQPGPYVAIEVEDNGTGMTESEKEKLFDPFFTTKFTGRGLGLAVVMGVVRDHLGGIRVETIKDSGTKISVVLPRVSAPDHELRELKEASIPRLSGCVLIIDDDASVRKMAESLLKSIGIEAHSVASGIKAITQINRDPTKFDAIMIDVTMPEMDGVETASRILNDFPNTKIMMCSGYSNVVMPTQLAEAVVFLQKPYRLKQLQEKLSILLDSGS